jgi:hypothetical protein
LDTQKSDMAMLTICCQTRDRMCVQVLVSTPQRNYTIADLSSLFNAIGDTQSVGNAAARPLATAVHASGCAAA